MIEIWIKTPKLAATYIADEIDNMTEGEALDLRYYRTYAKIKVRYNTFEQRQQINNIINKYKHDN